MGPFPATTVWPVVPIRAPAGGRLSTALGRFVVPYHGDPAIALVNEALLACERVYDMIRHHNSLDGRTPVPYVQERRGILVRLSQYVLNEYKRWVSGGRFPNLDADVSVEDW